MCVHRGGGLEHAGGETSSLGQERGEGSAEVEGLWDGLWEDKLTGFRVQVILPGSQARRAPPSAATSPRPARVVLQPQQGLTTPEPLGVCMGETARSGQPLSPRPPPSYLGELHVSSTRGQRPSPTQGQTEWRLGRGTHGSPPGAP